MITEWIRFAAVAALFAGGIVTLFLGLLGTFRLNDSLNGLHAASMLDSLVLLVFVVGCIVASGFQMVSLKFLLVLLLQWTTSPITAHMLTKLVFLTNRQVDRLLLKLEDTQSD